ncbi:MAG: hypothetical protein LAO03_22030 [Acidobacteriia bacterium]|nr:hypothetical protein [Terriglobia bacterium]
MEPRFIDKPKGIIWGRLTDEYDIAACCDAARRRHDPLFAPHGSFRHLASGNQEGALQFLERFGPLEETRWPVDVNRNSFPSELKVKMVGDIARTVRVDMADFWDKHITFRTISQIYETRTNAKALEGPWKILEQNWGRTGLLGRFVGLPSDYRKYPAPPFITDFWNQGPKQKQEAACHMAYFAVTHFLKDLRPWWHLEGEQVRFFVRPNSLWQMIWNSFANDTTEGPWRICATCNRVFYPRRRDQDCCNTRHQTLWSKREYARRMRAAKAGARKRSS